MEKEGTLAVFGGRYSNTDKAVQSYFLKQVHPEKIEYFPEIDEVFQSVISGDAKWGVVPFRNSNEGVVKATEEAFNLYKNIIEINGRTQMKIDHYLVGIAGALLEKVATIGSHPQALRQCKRWIEEHLPLALQEEKESTIFAVESVAKEGNPAYVAIAPFETSEAWNLKILAENIGPEKNETEFILIVRKEA